MLEGKMLRRIILTSVLLVAIVVGSFLSAFPLAEPVYASTETLRPNAAGDEESISYVYPTIDHYNAVNDVTPNDGDFVYTDSATYQRDLYNLPASSGTGTINYIKIYFRCKESASDGYAMPSLKSGSTVDDGTPISLTTTWTTYSEQWSTNPDDSQAWEWSDIDALQIGVSLKGDGSDEGRCSQVYVEIDYTPATTPSVTTNAETNVEETSATLNGNVTAINDTSITERGFVWDTSSHGDPGNVAPASSGYASNWTETGSFGTGSFSHGVTSLTKGELYYYRACAENNDGNWGYGDEELFLTKPDPPTGFTATADGETEIDLEWTNGTGSQKVYIIGKEDSAPANRGDYDWTWNGTGTSTSHTGLSAGEHWYYQIWSYATEGGETQTSDAPDPTDDATTAEVCSVTTTTCTGFGKHWAVLNGTITDLGGASEVTQYGFDYGLTDSYGSSWTSETVSITSVPHDFTGTVYGLDAGTVYHFRAKAYADGSWGYGDDMMFSTEGSPTIYEYLNTGGDGDSDAIYGSNYWAMQFTTGATAHTVTNINLMLKRTGSPGTITISLYHASGGLPTGLVLVETTYNGNNLSTSYQELSFEVTETSLEASSQYAIVVSAPSGDASNYMNWQIDSGGGLADAVSSSSTNGGTSWASESPKDSLFEIWGNVAFQVVSANVFFSYLEDDDMLITVEYENIYPPYVNVTDPTAYFQVQLLTTDGNTVLAAVPMPAWGYKVASIYLSEEVAASLTEGDPYYVRIYGIFTGNPSTQYQLQSIDWKGDNLENLDSWVINAAYNIQDYYSLTGDDVLIQVITGVGEQLTATGGGYFCSIGGAGGYYNSPGIPYLVNVRPDLFSVKDIYIEWDIGDPNLAYDAEEEFEEQVGSDIYQDMVSLGGLISVTPQQLGQIIIYCLIICMFWVLLGSGGTVFGGIFVASFLLLIGNHFRAISIQTTIVFAMAMILLFVVNFWWQNR